MKASEFNTKQAERHARLQVLDRAIGSFQSPICDGDESTKVCISNYPSDQDLATRMKLFWDFVNDCHGVEIEENLPDEAPHIESIQ